MQVLLKAYLNLKSIHRFKFFYSTRIWKKKNPFIWEKSWGLMGSYDLHLLKSEWNGVLLKSTSVVSKKSNQTCLKNSWDLLSELHHIFLFVFRNCNFTFSGSPRKFCLPLGWILFFTTSLDLKFSSFKYCTEKQFDLQTPFEMEGE